MQQKTDNPQRTQTKPKLDSLKSPTEVINPLVRLIKEKRGRTQISKISNERVVITTNLTDIEVNKI